MEVINVDREDETLIFGMDNDLRQKLTGLHEQLRDPQNTTGDSGLSGNQVTQSTETIDLLESRMTRVELEQKEMVEVMMEIYAALVSIREAQEQFITGP